MWGSHASYNNDLEIQLDQNIHHFASVVILEHAQRLHFPAFIYYKLIKQVFIRVIKAEYKLSSVLLIVDFWIVASCLLMYIKGVLKKNSF